MKNNKGITSLELVLIIFLFGLIIKYIFPLLNMSINLDKNNLTLNSKNYMYSNIIEAIKITKKNKEKVEVYGLNFLDIITEWDSNSYYSENINVEYKGENYILVIEKIDMLNNFMKISIKIYNMWEGKDETKGVEFLLEK